MTEVTMFILESDYESLFYFGKDEAIADLKDNSRSLDEFDILAVEEIGSVPILMSKDDFLTYKRN